MYTWGYLKSNILAKLNLTEEEANEQSFLSRFPFYANEAMTQICSAIKPQKKYLEILVQDKEYCWNVLRKKYNVYKDYSFYRQITPNVNDADYSAQIKFWEEWNTLHFPEDIIQFPEDFIAFSDAAAEIKRPIVIIGGLPTNKPEFEEAFDEDLEYYGYNQVICKSLGTYKIPYKARWFFFTQDLQNNVVITAPADICDAIPSYVASQCWKIDDETRAAIYRNEFEMACARIDDTEFNIQRTFNVRGGW